ncbi:MAG: inositol monophosphatase family protein [Actinomycetota bacterium]
MSSEKDLESLRAVAVGAAHEGGRVIIDAGSGARAAEEKSAGDYVTKTDRLAEEAIGVYLGGRTPDLPVVGEEYGGDPSNQYWLVDPLDGTTNFLHRFPIVGVSVTLIAEGRPVVGATHAPLLRTTFSAARGLGAQQDGRPLTVSAAEPEAAIVATGFPFREKDRLPRYLRMFERALDRFEDLRRPGAATLDLAWVAAGAFDGFFELGLSSWDVAAGALLTEEAGGIATDWEGGSDYLRGDILAGPPVVHEALLTLAQETGGE